MTRLARVRRPSEVFDSLRFILRQVPDLSLPAGSKATLTESIQAALEVLLPHITEDKPPPKRR